MSHEVHGVSAVMSSETDHSVMMTAFEAGAVDYLIKPIRRNEIVTLWQHKWRSNNKLAKPLALPAVPSGSDATWQGACRQTSGGRFVLKADQRSQSGWGSGDDHRSQPLTDEPVEV